MQSVTFLPVRYWKNNCWNSLQCYRDFLCCCY